MQNLQALYKEVTPKFLKYQDKIIEVETKVRELIKELEKAESNYDVDKMQQLTVQLDSFKKVYDRIKKDQADYKIKINESDDLYNKVYSAFIKDVKKEQEDQEIQETYKQIDEHRKKLHELESFIVTTEIEKQAEYQNMLNQFTKFLDEKKNVSSLGHGYMRYNRLN